MLKKFQTLIFRYFSSWGNSLYTKKQAIIIGQSDANLINPLIYKGWLVHRLYTVAGGYSSSYEADDSIEIIDAEKIDRGWYQGKSININYID